MNHKVINPAALAKPSGFAHGILAGNTVYLGGQTAMDSAGNIVRRVRDRSGRLLEVVTDTAGRILSSRPASQ